eukprot:5391735-Prymnesium_polylepis.1
MFRDGVLTCFIVPTRLVMADFSLPEGDAANGASERGGANAHTRSVSAAEAPRVRTPHQTPPRPRQAWSRFDTQMDVRALQGL